MSVTTITTPEAAVDAPPVPTTAPQAAAQPGSARGDHRLVADLVLPARGCSTSAAARASCSIC